MLSRINKYVSAGMLFVLLQSCIGCGTGNTSDHPKTVPVAGSVSYKGEPILEGLVTFYSKGEGNPAIGEIDENGNFVLTSYDKADGAVLGQHVVTVVVFPQGAVPGLEAEADGVSIPEKYSSPETSPLTVEVVEGSNELQLILED